MNRQDDPAFSGDLWLYRRIPPGAGHVKWDESGTPIPSSQNFSDKDKELSVYIANETTPEAVLEGNDGFGIVQLTAQNFRDVYAEHQKSLVICRDDEDPKNGHILICGKPSPKMKDQLRKLSRWVPGKWPVREPDLS